MQVFRYYKWVLRPGLKIQRFWTGGRQTGERRDETSRGICLFLIIPDAPKIRPRAARLPPDLLRV
jgi:hypothetical protein